MIQSLKAAASAAFPEGFKARRLYGGLISHPWCNRGRFQRPELSRRDSPGVWTFWRDGLGAVSRTIFQRAEAPLRGARRPEGQPSCPRGTALEFGHFGETAWGRLPHNLSWCRSGASRRPGVWTFPGATGVTYVRARSVSDGSCRLNTWAGPVAYAPGS
ncbi:MAG TPA: hypothetical protein VGL91_09455, partial [Acidobacteriota bacterium]